MLVGLACVIGSKANGRRAAASVVSSPQHEPTSPSCFDVKGFVPSKGIFFSKHISILNPALPCFVLIVLACPALPPALPWFVSVAAPATIRVETERNEQGIAHQSRVIRLPVHVHNLLNRIRRAQRELTSRAGEQPTDLQVICHAALVVVVVVVVDMGGGFRRIWWFRNFDDFLCWLWR